MDKFEYKKYIYYGIIGIISLVMVVFIPMLNSQVGIDFAFPTTTAGWLIFAITRLTTSILNVLIFHSFMQQAKLNVKDNNNFIKANEILGRIQNKLTIPTSPETWNRKQYTHKGITVFVFSALSTVVLTQSILSYDYTVLLVYATVLIMGLIFGILQMKSAEMYWTNEYYQYALYTEEKLNANIANNTKNIANTKHHIKSSSSNKKGEKEC